MSNIPVIFRFLKDLTANNNREWFNEHREEYEKHIYITCLKWVLFKQIENKLVNNRYIRISSLLTSIFILPKSIIALNKQIWE